MDTLKSTLKKLPPIEKVMIKKEIKKSSLNLDSKTSELNKFVKETIEQGYDEDRVRTVLISVGWTKEQVDNAFAKLEK